MNAVAQPATAPYLAAFERFASAANGWVHPLRRGAIERFGALGFPSTKLEAWRYTNVAAFTGAPLAVAPEPAAAPSDRDLARFSGPRLVFVNGVMAPDLSRLNGLPTGVSLGSLGDATARNDEARPFLAALAATGDAFVALNTAFWQDGAFLRLKAGAVVDAPVHVVFWNSPAPSPAMRCPRLLVVAGEQSRLTLVESHVHAERDLGLAAGVSELFLAKGSHVEHVQMVEGASASHHIGATRVRQDEASHYGSHVLVCGGGVARRDVQIELAGAGARVDLSGLYLGRDREHVDCFTFVDHAVPHTQSNQLYKGVLAERAQGVFNGKVVVRQNAQKADATQHNRNLLLSKGAVAHTRPQLEIYANDVKCVHGATVGQLDGNALFYLRSRGIDAEAARGLLVHSFVSEVIARFPEAVRSLVEAGAQARLGALEGA